MTIKIKSKSLVNKRAELIKNIENLKQELKIVSNQINEQKRNIYIHCSQQVNDICGRFCTNIYNVYNCKKLRNIK